MKKGICYIVGAGEVGRLSITRAPGDYLVAADGGLEKLRAHGLEPDLVLGDFDSVTKLPEHPNILRFPVRKDDTDTMLALRLMLKDGWRIFCIYGGTGRAASTTHWPIIRRWPTWLPTARRGI